MIEDPFRLVRLVDEVQVSAIRHGEDGDSRTEMVRVNSQDCSPEVLERAFTNVVYSLIEKDEMERAGIPSRTDSLAKAGRILDVNETADMASLIDRFSSSPNPYSSEEPMPLRTGRRLACIHLVACVNRRDWLRGPLYIPTPLGLERYIRTCKPAGRFGFMLEDFSMRWAREYEKVLQAQRSYFESQPSI